MTPRLSWRHAETFESIDFSKRCAYLADANRRLNLTSLRQSLANSANSARKPQRHRLN